MSNFFRNRNSIGSLPTIKKQPGSPTLEAYSTVTDGTRTLYYKKFGKLYVILGIEQGGAWYQVVGGSTNGAEHTSTTEAIASLLGITKAAICVASEAGDNASWSISCMYYSGGWSALTTSWYPLMAILAV